MTIQTTQIIRFIQSFALLFLSATAVFGQNDIVMFKNLIQDVDEAVWTDGNGSPIGFNEDVSLYGKAKLGQRCVSLGDPRDNPGGVLLTVESLKANVIDLEFAPTLGRTDREIRGSYVIQLPVKKRIQLEAAYDLPLDFESNRGKAEFRVEVFERNRLNPDEWIKTGEKNVRNTPHRSNNHRFTVSANRISPCTVSWPT